MGRLVAALLGVLWAPSASAASLTLPSMVVQPSSTAEAPGLSPALFANPGYTCAGNFYVAPNGSDAGPGTQAAPWATLQRADASSPAAGTCINVASGVYPTPIGGLALTHGGNAENAYVAYRSATLGGAVLRATATVANPVVLAGSYLWLDGFDVDGNATGCVGKPCSTDYAVKFLAGATTHNQRITNVSAHGSGGGGFGEGAGGDCAVLAHNVAYGNASTSGYAESGFSIWEAHAIAGLASCNWADGLTYHLRFQWDDAHNNAEGPSIQPALHTDGDGFIIDTMEATAYPYPVLIANNTAWNNGGFCVGEDGSDNVTLANNTCYGNYQDPLNTGTWRGEMHVQGGKNIVIVNDILDAVTGAGVLANNSPLTIFAGAIGVTTASSVMYGGAPHDFTGQNPVSCTANKCSADPLLVAPAAGNMALGPGSPAIGYATHWSQMPRSDVDAGACSASLTVCPAVH